MWDGNARLCPLYINSYPAFLGFEHVAELSDYLPDLTKGSRTCFSQMGFQLCKIFNL